MRGKSIHLKMWSLTTFSIPLAMEESQEHIQHGLQVRITSDKCLESKDWPDDIRLKALEYIRKKSREEGIDAALRFGQKSLDGLLVPLQADKGVACSLAAKAGYPMITVPVGVNDAGVPFGIGIIQTAWKEHLLVKYGSAIESLVGGRKQPQFLNLEADNFTYIGSPPE